ncbi:MAG: hypothetical protein U5K27_19595 [Desulfotignum sp.]|nr:hypothetical protein [Desulfotignum sp.]
MKTLHPYIAIVLALVFFWVSGSANAWNSQQRHYDPYGSGHGYNDRKGHHPRYDRSYPKHKQYRHHKRKHYRNTPSWKNYNRRLYYRFNGFSKKYYHGSNHRYNTDYTFSEGWELVRHELTKNYQSRFYGLTESDKQFMIASLYYLINDLDRCIAALEKNHAAGGDRAVSTRNLYHLAGYEAYN